MHRKIGDPVRKGEPLCEVHGRDRERAAAALAELQQGVRDRRGTDRPARR